MTPSFYRGLLNALLLSLLLWALIIRGLFWLFGEVGA